MSERQFRSTLFDIGPLSAVELVSDDIPTLQEFFVANPEYFIAVNGVPPRSSEAFEEFHDQVPAEMSFTKIWRIGFIDESGAMIGMASVVSDLVAENVWHIGLYIIATRLHGQGTAKAIHDALESWMHCHGAAWVRLGVVEGNTRAEKFWENQGYVETRKRHGVEMGAKVNSLRVMVKAQKGGTLGVYLTKVARDRPE
jgi:RimJ/RimL family protein N-acetyltransferase